MEKLDWKDILIRASKTFVQAFLAGWAVTGYDFTQVALLGALSGAVSAVWNIGLELLRK